MGESSITHLQDQASGQIDSTQQVKGSHTQRYILLLLAASPVLIQLALSFCYLLATAVKLLMPKPNSTLY